MSALRDIHTLDSAPFWPPAPGWWLLLAGAVAVGALAYVVLRWLRRYPLGSWQRDARNALRQLKRRQHLQTPKESLGQLSELLRRIAMARFGRHGQASLAGDAWLARLSAWDRSGFDWQGQGRLLARGPYAPDVDETERAAVETLIDAAQRLVADSAEAVADMPSRRWAPYRLGRRRV